MSRTFTIIIILLAVILLFSIITMPKSTSPITTLPAIAPVKPYIKLLQRDIVIPTPPQQKVTVIAIPQATKTVRAVAPKYTIAPLSPNQYRITTILTPGSNSSVSSVLVGLTYIIYTNMTLNCTGYETSVAPWAASNGVVYDFKDTPCKEHDLARLVYSLPNGVRKTMKMGLEYQGREFKLDKTGG